MNLAILSFSALLEIGLYGFFSLFFLFSFYFSHFSCKIISFIFSMHPFIPHHDKVYTILKTIIWYFFNAICFVFNATNIYFCIVVSFKKRLQTCIHIEFSFHSVCLYVRPYNEAKKFLNMQFLFPFCNFLRCYPNFGV